MSFSPTKVPPIITSKIKALCKKVTEQESLYFVDIIKRPEFQTNKCAYNAKIEASNINGEIIFGWSVVIWDNVFLQFIGHAIVKDDKGNKYCVTPSKYNESKVLFAPDKNISFDFKNKNARLPSKTVAISKHKIVQKLIDTQQEIYNIKTKYPVTSGVIQMEGADTEKISLLEKKEYDLINHTIYLYHPIKDKCSCGSGKQFRKCCRPHMRNFYK
ncbi:MAG: hypothetical protein HFP81_00110 [Methylococcales symbiont of Hymedesmia sp. n. MRB-2018]|nr:MAG: hypothetical protein HFP78_00350 [Methylococcales symbiont of Hymedesmia sp. n. MRB-2018]KAF3984825.1 MAG: hypothetical protein HFP81_00110 [Methylococcales symbiont of Hymedesmia sp. n. MRB-2018]